ncbi:uncharacterized protein UV8b_04423 [Ustilaginoidea virens]|uniref:Uncharacterized protein n=1 Tax=Ustilaginoidea virens TaxID=1159556 RepID=A0A8E5MI43_USTVR|nr:uncharacterized protein UV8b_04423 [Ustilaginoidea virens]QUC20182.1 hypothetical protein UV8b_04423 [Ustilaginoidea virens]
MLPSSAYSCRNPPSEDEYKYDRSFSVLHEPVGLDRLHTPTYQQLDEKSLFFDSAQLWLGRFQVTATVCVAVSQDRRRLTLAGRDVSTRLCYNLFPLLDRSKGDGHPQPDLTVCLPATLAMASDEDTVSRRRNKEKAIGSITCRPRQMPCFGG